MKVDSKQKNRRRLGRGIRLRVDVKVMWSFALSSLLLLHLWRDRKEGRKKRFVFEKSKSFIFLEEESLSC